ncbi:MAG: hypothetical protein U0804_01900 [Gemmataceae bacterium]
MTAELDPLDAVIDRVRLSEPPADGWRRARARAARRRRRPRLAFAAVTAVIAVVFVTTRSGPPEVKPVVPPEFVQGPESSVPVPQPTPEPVPINNGMDGTTAAPAAGGAMAGVWPAPELVVASNAPVFVCTGGAAPIRTGGTVPAGTVGERVHVWNWEKSPDSRVLDAAIKGPLALTPDGATLLTADGRAVNLAAGTAEPLAWWGAAGLKLRPRWAMFSPDARTLLAFEHDEKVGTARLIDYPAGTERARVGGLWWAASRAAFSADGKTVALFGSDAHLRTFDAATGKEKVRLAPAFENTIQSIAVSADGARVAGSYRDVVRVWDAATGKLVCEPNTKGSGPISWFAALAFAPDGTRLAGASTDGLVLWDAANGTVVRRFPRESMLVGHARFDAAGATITTVKQFYIQGDRNGRESTVYPTADRWPVREK